MNTNNKSKLILGWHGGWGKFKAVDSRYFGKGEGDALGWGFYMAENRKGGEYYGEYFWKRNCEGFLHRIVVTTSEHAIWRSASRVPVTLKNGSELNLSSYIGRIKSDGREAAAKWLLGQGIDVIECWEENNYRHGYTYVTLNPELITVLETHQYIGDKCFAEWVAIS